MRKSLLSFLILFLLAACLSTYCEPPPPATSPSELHPWAGALRALDPADAATPAYDITAVYLQPAGDLLQVRVDLLAFQNAADLSLDVEIRDGSDPETPPLTIHIPSGGDPSRLSFDPLLATVTVDVPFSALPSRPLVGVSTPEDAVTGLSLRGPPPSPSAPLLLTFYDTFAARFPAEALRSWDGAHTGPRGERHGLKHLLDAAEEFQTPIVLLDLKAPETLSALEAMEVMAQIRQMESEGLLLLPDVRTEIDLAGFCQTCRVLELPESPFGFDAEMRRYRFHFQQDSVHLYKPVLSRTTFIPIATENDANQPTPEGPPLEVRRALLETALNAEERDLLVLGGSLRDSTWGSPGMAEAALAYFASRPYIRVLTGDALMHFPANTGEPEKGISPRIDDPLHQLGTHYKNLTQPALDFAAHWQGSPLSSCGKDIDKDSQPECVLADGGHLAILDPQGARLTYLFAVERKGPSPTLRQLIGPSWQVAAGLSNPSLWDLSAGEAADPGAFPGAFTDTDDPFRPYTPALAGNKIVFTSFDGTRVKSFSLGGKGLQVEYGIQEPVSTQIPLLVEPDTRFTPGWASKYVREETNGGVAWALADGPVVTLRFEDAALPSAEGAIKMQTFQESLPLLATPEDPDFDYPPGHYLPFPMAVAEVQLASGVSTIQLAISP